MRTAVITRVSLLAGAAIALPTLIGCLDHPLKPVDLESESPDEKQIQLAVNKDVDILFVIDNSGSMGEEQANLAANFGAFIEELEKDGVEANYRIGITTTDNGNPWCGGTTTPEAGALVLSSCQGRLGQFVFTGTNPATDVTDIACTDICPYGPAELDDAMKATTTDLDPNAKVRPWLENIEGATNLPDGISTVEAFQCFGPQGIDGCGFESHLESMYKALQRTKNQGERSYGFLRDDAILAIVVVTDEVDCSYRSKYDEIFTTNTVYWSDPQAPNPTSAVCWNAGVECSGGPGQYDGCKPADRDLNGNVTTDPDQAVLHPLSRYKKLIQGFEQAKKETNPNQEVIVGVISGVPDGYYKGQGDIIYADTQDADFQGDFGIGPGCSSGSGDDLQRALPPVRLRDWAEEFDDDGTTNKNLYSVCSDDYTPALKAIAKEIEDQIKPACYTECVADVDPAEDGLQVDCYVEEEAPGKPKTVIPECTYIDGEYELPSANDNVCYITLTDPTQTGDPNDDMSDECIARGFNLEYAIVRREGFPAAGGTSVTATCKLAEFSQLECPDLGK